MIEKIKVAIIFFVISGIKLAAQPISLCPSNQHYFTFRGKPEILITSAEHYGAVVNGEFEYVILEICEKFSVKGNSYKIGTPEYTIDIALRIKSL